MGISIKLPPLHKGVENRSSLDLKFSPECKDYSTGGQEAVIKAGARFNVVFAGRRWGKSMLALVKLLSVALRGGATWWIWPNQKMARNGWEFLKNMTKEIPGAEIRETEKRIMFGGRGYIQIISAHDPDAQRGSGLHLIVMDEASFMRRGLYMWEKVVRAALMENEGDCLFITSPNGFDWVYKLYMDAKTQEDWEGWRFPTWDNPYVPTNEVKEASQVMSLEAFNQEIAAMNFASSANVFGNIYDVATAETEGPKEGHEYSAGLDLGRHFDPTVLIISDESVYPKKQVYKGSWVNLQWDDIYRKVKKKIEKYNVDRIVIDSTGIGDAISEQWEEELGDKYEIVRYTFTTKSKTRLIRKYALALEKGNYILLNDQRLIGEHQDFEGKRNEQTLHVSYQAKTGHDDIVIASALCWHGMAENKIMMVMN